MFNRKKKYQSRLISKRISIKTRLKRIANRIKKNQVRRKKNNKRYKYRRSTLSNRIKIVNGLLHRESIQLGALIQPQINCDHVIPSCLFNFYQCSSISNYYQMYYSIQSFRARINSNVRLYNFLFESFKKPFDIFQSITEYTYRLNSLNNTCNFIHRRAQNKGRIISIRNFLFYPTVAKSFSLSYVEESIKRKYLTLYNNTKKNRNKQNVQLPYVLCGNRKYQKRKVKFRYGIVSYK